MNMLETVRLMLAVSVIVGNLFCASQAWAHHAFAGTYFPDKVVTIRGRVVEFLFRNPHSVILVEISGENGQLITWAVECGGAGQLSRQGVEKDSVKPGDYVIVTGNPSRNSADHRMHLQDLTRPSDGWKWSSGL